MNIVTRRVQLGFGRLQAPDSCVRRTVVVPQRIEAEVRELAQTVAGGRALAELLERWPPSYDRVGDRVLEALADGRLEYVEWSPVAAFNGLPGRRGEVDALSSLAAVDLADDLLEVAVHAVIIELIDSQDRPVAGEAYRLVDPVGTAHVGTLDGDGRAEVRAIRTPGPCKVSFPRLDGDMWSYVEARPL